MVTVMPRQQHGMMLGPMRGHMAPNSSPFKPTINKLSSQYLIQDHMSSHYMKLGTAKPAIDSKPPKSMTTSVKKRDQMRREAMAKQMKLFDFEKGMKHGSSGNSRHSIDSSTYGSQRMLSATVTKTGLDEKRPRSVSSFHSDRASPRPYSSSPARPRSASSTRLPVPSSSKSPRDKSQSRKPDALTETYSGDYLDKHEDRFKNNDTPFTPRLKKRGGKSFLSKSKHYAPPLVVHKETKRKISPRKSHPAEISPTSSTSSMRKEEKIKKKTPRDNETVDERTRSLRRLSLDSKKTYDNIYPERNSYDTYGFRHGADDSFFGTSSLSGRFSRNETFSTYTKSRIEAEEEEMKYLEFINSVTNDILTRGVYSDRVLKQVMERHLIQNKGRLDETRMRHMLKKLQQDLGVSSSPPDEYSGSGLAYHGEYEHSMFSDGDYHKSDVRSKSRSSTPSNKAPSIIKPFVRERSSDLSDDDTRNKPKPKRRGILKSSGGASSGSDIDRRSAVSSGDEKEKASSHNSGADLRKDGDQTEHDDLLADTVKSDISVAELSRVLSISERPALSTKSVSIEEGLNEIASMKSSSAHSIGSLRSDKKSNERLSDLDDF